MRDDIEQLRSHVRDLRSILASARQRERSDHNLPMPRESIHEVERELFEAEIRLERAKFILDGRAR